MSPCHPLSSGHNTGPYRFPPAGCCNAAVLGAHAWPCAQLRQMLIKCRLFRRLNIENSTFWSNVDFFTFEHRNVIKFSVHTFRLKLNHCTKLQFWKRRLVRIFLNWFRRLNRWSIDVWPKNIDVWWSFPKRQRIDVSPNQFRRLKRWSVYVLLWKVVFGRYLPTFTVHMCSVLCSVMYTAVY